MAFYPVRLSLYQLGVVVPTHRVYKVVCRRYKRSLVFAYQLVGAFAVGQVYVAGEGKDVASIVLRQVCCNKAAALFGTLHNNGCVGKTSNNAVASNEVHLVGVGARHKLGSQSALVKHLGSRLPVSGRVEIVQSVSQNAHRLHTVLQCSPVRVDVHAVCQTANDDGVWAHPL